MECWGSIIFNFIFKNRVIVLRRMPEHSAHASFSIFIFPNLHCLCCSSIKYHFEISTDIMLPNFKITKAHFYFYTCLVLKAFSLFIITIYKLHQLAIVQKFVFIENGIRIYLLFMSSKKGPI